LSKNFFNDILNLKSKGIGFIFLENFINAGVVKLVDTLGLGPSAFGRGGSSPFSGKIMNPRTIKMRGRQCYQNKMSFEQQENITIFIVVFVLFALPWLLVAFLLYRNWHLKAKDRYKKEELREKIQDIIDLFLKENKIEIINDQREYESYQERLKGYIFMKLKETGEDDTKAKDVLMVIRDYYKYYLKDYFEEKKIK
jgi:hypothetical protein